MRRRTFLKTAAAVGALTAVGGVGAPPISRAAARPLRLVPHADLANFDPIWNSAYIARNAGVLVWDTLYGVDDRLRPQRQMVEAEDVSADGLTCLAFVSTTTKRCWQRTRWQASIAGRRAIRRAG